MPAEKIKLLMLQLIHILQFNLFIIQLMCTVNGPK